MAMPGGNPVLSGTVVLSFGKVIPLRWWVPQKERAVLAVVSTSFWFASITQALYNDSAGASVLAFYGLGALYVICGMANLSGAIRATLASNQRRSRRASYEQPQSLLQLFGILVSMLFFNSIVLSIYVSRGVHFTPLDRACVILAAITLAVLIFHYGIRRVFMHPFSRGYLALVSKGVPQLILAGIFLLQPAATHAFTLWSLASLTLLATLRFLPSLLAFKRDTKSPHLRGLLLGEAGNEISVLCMAAAWLWAVF